MSNVALYVMVVLIWGSTWIGIEFQLGVVPPEMSVFYRYLAAAAILFTWSWLRRLPLRFGRRGHARFALLGLFLFSVNYLFAYHAQRYVTSALIAISFSMLVWMNIINARLLFGVRSGRNVLVGALLGLAGTGMMFWPSIDSLSLTDATVIGGILGISGTYIASLGNMVSQSAQKARLPVLQTNAWGMFYGAVIMAVVVLARGEPLVFDTSPTYVLSFAYLVIFGSIIAFGAYLELLGRIGANRAGYASVMFPVVALIISALFEDMTIEPLTVCGLATAIAGNFFVMRRDPRPQRMAHR